MSGDVWGDDKRTNTAIEHLHLLGAKTDSAGRVIPRHRYTRKAERVFALLCTIVWAPRYQSFSLTDEREGDQTTVTARINVESSDGRSWEQEGVVSSTEEFYDWHAMAMCRALLQYAGDDGETMTPDQVLAMLERKRADYLKKNRPAASSADGPEME